MSKGETPRTLGEYIRARRHALELSARKAELLSGVDMRYWNKLEKDQIAQPKASYLVDMARALDVPWENLYTLAGYEVPERLPELMPYLRARLDMSPQDAADLADFMDIFLRGYFGVPADQPVFPEIPATERGARKPPAPDARNGRDHPWHGGRAA